MVEFAHLVDGYTLTVLAILGAHVAALGLVQFAHFVVATTHRIPHAGVFGPG